MSVRHLLVPLAAAALLLSACGGSTGTVATVNGTAIPRTTFERLVRAQVDEATAQLDELSDAERVAAIADLQRQVLSQLIRNALIVQAAAQLGVEVTDAEVEQRWQQEAAALGSEQALRDRIAELGLTEAEARDQLRALLLQDAIAQYFTDGVVVDDEEVAARYEQDREQYEVARVAHILVDTEEEARAIIDLLAAGEDFAELARTRSTDTASAARGGDLGENPRGRFVPEFDEAVWSAQPGQVVGPVQTQFGWHVIRVDGFRTIPLEEVADRIRADIARDRAQEALRAFVAQVLRDAEVEVDDRYGTYDPDRGLVVAAEDR